jgi:hypothetical protein
VKDFLCDGSSFLRRGEISQESLVIERSGELLHKYTNDNYDQKDDLENAFNLVKPFIWRIQAKTAFQPPLHKQGEIIFLRLVART